MVAANRPIGLSDDIPDRGSLELVFYPPNVPLPPVQFRRSPYVFRQDALVVVTSAGNILDVPFWGRQRATFTLQANTSALVYKIFGERVVRGDDDAGAGNTVIEVQLYPASGFSTLAAAGTVQVIIENEHWDYLRLYGSQASGSTHVIVECRDP